MSDPNSDKCGYVYKDGSQCDVIGQPTHSVLEDRGLSHPFVPSKPSEGAREMRVYTLSESALVRIATGVAAAIDRAVNQNGPHFRVNTESIAAKIIAGMKNEASREECRVNGGR